MITPSQNEELKVHLGIAVEDIDKDAVIEKLVESFLYHEKMADSSIAAISSKSENAKINHNVLWDSFETNNTLAYSLRSILMAAVPDNPK
jgi:hypothetical protein